MNHKKQCCFLTKKYIECLKLNYKRPYYCYEILQFLDRIKCL